MISERELVDALRADLKNTELKLAYAELAEATERGKFAELLRLSCEPEPEDNKEARKYDRRMRSLSDKVCDKIHAHYQTFGLNLYGRPLIHYVEGKRDGFVSQAAELFEKFPINIVTFLEGGDFQAVAACPQLEHARDIWFRNSMTTGPQFAQLLASPYLGNLRTLIVERQMLDEAGCRALATADLPALRVLAGRDSVLDVTGMRHLAASRLLGQLERLNVTQGRLLVEGARCFARSPYLSGLTHLEIGGNGFGDEGVKALAESQSLRNLDELNLSGDQLTVAGITALAQSPILETVTILQLNHTRIDDAAVMALAASPYLRQAKQLHFQDVSFGNLGLAALVNSPIVAKLTHLHLCGTKIDNDAALILAQSPRLPETMTEINVTCTTITRSSKGGKALKARFGKAVQFHP